MLRVHALLVAAMVSACDRPEACEPVFEGSDAEVRLAEDVWWHMVERLHDPLCVRDITFADEVRTPRNLPDHLYARGRAYRRPGGTRVRIKRESEPKMRATLVHELCHAASFQHGYGERPAGIPLLDEPVARRTWREEAFALWCEQGADAPALLAGADLDPGEASMVAFLRQEVWRGAPEPLPAYVATELAHLELELIRAIDPEGEAGFTELGVLAFEGASGPTQLQVDLNGGMYVRTGAQRAELLGRAPLPHISQLIGLEAALPGDDWQPHGELRVGHVRMFLPTSTYVGAAIVSAYRRDLAPAVLAFDRSLRFVGDGDGLIAGFRSETGRDLTLYVWSLRVP